jgi:hypothetical protein
MKFCPSCNQEKSKLDFYTNKRTPDGVSYTCKSCMSAYSKQYRADNEARLAQLKKNWYVENKEEALAYAAEYYQQNKEEIIKKVVNYRSKRLKTDVEFRLQKNLRHRLGKLLKQQSSSIAVTFLGCSLEEFKLHLERNFQPGMTWDNYGSRGWHIDHKMPLSAFNLQNEEEVKKACHYSNLQPLWWQDNLSKSNKVE